MSDFAIDKFNPERFGLVTGSKCSVLFPMKGDGKKGQRTYAKELANEMFFRTYDEFQNWQMQHGSMHENSAFEHYQEYYNEDVERGGWKRRGNCGGTSDAIVPGSHGIDFKCPTTLNAWLDYLHEPLSKDQYHQCQMYCHLWDLEYWEIAAHLEETKYMTDNGLTYPVPLAKRMIRVQVHRHPDWEADLQEPLAFVIEERDGFFKELKAYFGQVEVCNS